MNPASLTAVALSSAATTVGAGYSAYLTVVGFAAQRELRSSASTAASTEPSTRFRIMIPAHDEELLIKDTVAAALDISYPPQLFEVHVVADNCTDRTAEVAADAGAVVHERTDATNPGKGPALMWLLDELPPGNVGDAVVIIDADTIVDPTMLRAFASKLEDGAVAVQGHYAVRGEGGGGEIDLRSAAFAVRHLVRPAGRVGLGGSSSLYGNGMAFTEDIARRFPWSAHLTEDLDMGLRLLLAGETVEFAARAVVRGEMPESRDAATSQHERWESGRQAVARNFVPQLLRAARTRRHGKRWTYIDASVDIAMPPFGTLAALTGAGAAGFGLFARGNTRRTGVAVAISALGLQSAHIFLALRLAEAPPSVYRSLLRAPVNVLWKLGLLRRIRRDEPKDWVRTSRNSAGIDQQPDHGLNQHDHDHNNHDTARRNLS